MILFSKKRILSAVALLLASFILLGLVSCTEETESDTTPIFECGEETLPLYFYEFMLSRAKGTLARNKYPVDDPEFWDTVIEGDGRTYEEFYNTLVLESCKDYFAGALIFDSEGLTLSKSSLAAIDEEVAYYIDYDGDGSEDKFNALIGRYGIDAKALRECYIIEAKYNYVVSYLYGDGELIGDGVKDEYYRANYHRFKQILLTNYYYEYQKDSEGNLIYFDDETGKPIYDQKNGSVKYDSKGYRIKDSFGVEIYYDKDGNILYDTVKGKPAPVPDEKGEGVKHSYTAEEMAERLRKAEAICASIKKGDTEKFESELARINAEELLYDAFPEGYYLSRTEADNYIGYDHVLQILDELEDMDDGEVKLIETSSGYHVIMKYELDDGRFNDGEYAAWFNDFNSNIISKLFGDKLDAMLSEITTHEENLEGARSIRNIGINFDY